MGWRGLHGTRWRPPFSGFSDRRQGQAKLDFRRTRAQEFSLATMRLGHGADDGKAEPGAPARAAAS